MKKERGWLVDCSQHHCNNMCDRFPTAISVTSVYVHGQNFRARAGGQHGNVTSHRDTYDARYEERKGDTERDCISTRCQMGCDCALSAC